MKEQQSKTFHLVLFPSPSSLFKGLSISQGTTQCSSLTVELPFPCWVPCLRPTEKVGKSQLDEPAKGPGKVRKDLGNEPDLEGIREWLTTAREREELLWRGPAYKPERERRQNTSAGPSRDPALGKGRSGLRSETLRRNAWGGWFRFLCQTIPPHLTWNFLSNGSFCNSS